MQVTVTVNQTTYTRLLLGFLVLFAVFHPLLNTINAEYSEIHWLVLQLVDLDDENNLPTWFSSFLLANASLISLNHAQKALNHSVYWKTLATGFLILSIDEVAGIHETINTAIEMTWVYPALALVIAVGLLFIPFLISLDRALLVKLIIAGGLYLSGVLGIEYLSADMDEDALEYEYAVTIEETLEMLGIWLYIAVMLRAAQNADRSRPST